MLASAMVLALLTIATQSQALVCEYAGNVDPCPDVRDTGVTPMGVEEERVTAYCYEGHWYVVYTSIHWHEVGYYDGDGEWNKLYDEPLPVVYNKHEGQC
jgi:hypothetical protein